MRAAAGEDQVEFVFERPMEPALWERCKSCDAEVFQNIDSCKTCAWCIATTLSRSRRRSSRRCPSRRHRYAPRDPDQRWPKVDFSEWCGEYVERCGYERAV